MAEFNEMANTPVEFELMGKTVKVRRVPLGTIFGKAEAAVIATQMKRIHEMAALLEPEERTTFLAKAMLESIPTGQRLSQMSISFLQSPEGTKLVLVDAMKKDQPTIEKELDIALLMVTEMDKVRTIVQFASGRFGKDADRPLPPAGA